MEGNENKPIDYLRTIPDQEVGWGYRLVTVSGFGEPAAASGRAWFCSSVQFGDNKHFVAVVESEASEAEINSQWDDALRKVTQADLAQDYCNEHKDIQSAREQLKGYTDTYSKRGYPIVPVPFTPNGPASSQRKTKAVSFRDASGNERGYRGVTFDVEYQFILCSGEIHIAYSIVEDSVRRAPSDVGGYGSVLYKSGGQTYPVSLPPKTILSLPLKGRVYPRFNFPDTIGTFADDNAGKALGFGCFSSQSQKIADLKDVVDDQGHRLTDMSKEYVSTFLTDRLDVAFETTQVLTSAEAEDEIRARLSKEAAAKEQQANKAGDEPPLTDKGPSEADLRAQRRAQEDAEFQAQQKAYEEGVAAHKAQVEQYQKALADVEAQKAANAAAAKAQQEEFARKQADYNAEVARARRDEEEYETKYGKPR